MMYPYPFFGFPNFRRPYHYYPNYSYLHNAKGFNAKNIKKPSFPSVSQKEIKEKLTYSSTCSKKTKKTEFEDSNSDDFFEIFGLKLHFDDLLIIALLFFLYKEEVKDMYLYISLILLLLS